MQRDLRVMVLHFMYVWRKKKGFAAFGRTEHSHRYANPGTARKNFELPLAPKMVLLKI